MATAKSIEVVKVTHNQVKKRAENLTRGHTNTTRDDHGTEVKSPPDSDNKDINHPARAKSSKGRKEKEQRKPDQELYRPGRSRTGRTPSTATSGSDLNSSREESPMKPIGSSLSEELESVGDHSSVLEDKGSNRDSVQRENKEEHKVEDEPKHQRKNTDQSRKQERKGGRGHRGDRMDRMGSADNESGRDGPKRSDRSEQPLHQEKGQGGRRARDEACRPPPDGKNQGRNVKKQSGESWEIRPEDWEAEVKTPPRGAKSKISENKSPPKQFQSGNEKVRNQKPDTDDSPETKCPPPHVESLMGTDWDSEFENQLRSQRKGNRSPQKQPDRHQASGDKRLDTGERLPRNRSNVENRHNPSPSSERNDQETKSKEHKGQRQKEEETKPVSKKDLVKSSRQNYATEMQKLRAKKEQQVETGDKQSRDNTAPSKKPPPKDLQITIKQEDKGMETSRIVQEKTTKRYSSERFQQRANRESSTRNENPAVEKADVQSREIDSSVDDLNYRVESMVITNQKFLSSEHDESGYGRDRGRRRDADDELRNRVKSGNDPIPSRSEKQRVDHGPSRTEKHVHERRDSHRRERESLNKQREHQNEERREDHHKKDSHHPRRRPEEDHRSQEHGGHIDSGGREMQGHEPKDRNDSGSKARDQRGQKDSGHIGHEPRGRNDSSGRNQDQRGHKDSGSREIRGNEPRNRNDSGSRAHDQHGRKDSGGRDMRGHEPKDRNNSGGRAHDQRARSDSSGMGQEPRGRNNSGSKDHEQRGRKNSGGREMREREPRGRNDSGSKHDVGRRRDRDRISVSSDDGSERWGRSRVNSAGDDSSGTHGGGILRLPISGTTESESSQQQQHHHSYAPVYDQFYQPPEPQREAAPSKREEPKAKARAGDASRLWDPSKPNQKPALQQHQSHGRQELHFTDPENERGDADVREGSPVGQQESWNSYAPFYPPGFGQMLPHPGMNTQYPFPSHGYPMRPPQSWAEQMEAGQAYMAGGAQPPHPGQMMPYSSPFGGHPYQGHPGIPPAPGMHPPPGFPNPAQIAMMQEHQSLNRQSAQKLLRDAARCETELTNAISEGIASRDALHQLLDKRQELEQLYEGIILLDLDLCNQYNVEQNLWKNSYYQLIEGLRRAIQTQPNGESYKEDLLDLMQHGTSFYEGLLNKLQSTYNFQLENRTGLDPLHEEPRRTIKLALLSSQRCMIALGDIARYKEQANETSNYGKARSWYMKSQHLAPRNGRPYNQLAILALYTRRKLDAVYYYVRSLAATNPFLTARESLMTLFEEVRRKVAHKEQEEMAERKEMERRREKRRQRRRKPSGDENRGRTEVWVAHDGRQVGGERLEEEEDNEKEMGEDLTKLSPAELNKKFVLSFLNVHGKLFTKIGMEAFEHSVEKLVREFKALLDHSPTAILSTRLIQLMAINMFAVTNTSPQVEDPSTEDMRPLLVEQAVQFGLDMFAILVKRCCTLLQEHPSHEDPSLNLLSQDLRELLPGVKVYADWMMCHPSLWNPPPCCNTTSYSAAVDVWSTLAEFLTLVKRISVPDVNFASGSDKGSQEVLLPEDMTLSGFVPLLALPLQPVFIQAETSKILAYDRVRLDSLAMFGEYLSGQETPLISFTIKTDSYISVAPKNVQPRHIQQTTRMGNEDNRDDNSDVVVMESYNDEDDVAPDDGTISRLRERRDSLERQVRDRERRENQIQAIVESHRTQRQLEIIIKPYYLIPDTNCFIDHLTAIQRLVSCERYIMVIPLVVINELDGLARGSRQGQYSDPDHAANVLNWARQAVAYLEDAFARRNRCLRAMTSKGTILDTIRFRSEEAEWRGNNDDHILWCCMHYCNDDARQYLPHDKDAPLQIQREVVLLTNDRNLRVKAIQQNVPVKDIDLFVRWAQV